jgi:hypothetical protein
LADEDEGVEELEEESDVADADEEEVIAATEIGPDELRNLTRDRILFYAGLALIMVGGPGLAFGSWIHDSFNVPIVGESYHAFGWINTMFATVGIVMMVIGIILLALSLRGGVITKREIKRLEELKSEV